MKEIWKDDFKGFPIGAFPYDPEHSAMGEYHYYPAQGYQGSWYDPITGSSYRGPSWIITEQVVWWEATQTVPFLTPDASTMALTSFVTSWNVGIQPRD